MTGDADALAHLITELGYPTTAESMKARLSLILPERDYATIVADVNGTVVGVAGATLGRYYEKDGVYTRLLILAVACQARRLGIGRRLVQAVEQWAVKAGAREVFVNSGLHRVDAHGFYERCGYSRTGYRFTKRITAG